MVEIGRGLECVSELTALDSSVRLKDCVQMHLCPNCLHKSMQHSADDKIMVIIYIHCVKVKLATGYGTCMV